MRKLDWKKMTVTEVGAAVCNHLRNNKIPVVLSGGACVSIYSNNQHTSRDLDFVMSDYSLKEIDPIMESLGFRRTENHRHYENPDCIYFVEFPPSPLMVGEEFVTKTAIIKNIYGKLRLLRPVDSVKDRLSAFYHWNDRQALEQAILICKTKRIDKNEIKKWSQKEGALEKYKYFAELLKKE